MTKCEKINLLMEACNIALAYYKGKAQTEGISAIEWSTCMDLIDKYDSLYINLMPEYFKEFAKENG